MFAYRLSLRAWRLTTAAPANGALNAMQQYPITVAAPNRSARDDEPARCEYFRRDWSSIGGVWKIMIVLVGSPGGGIGNDLEAQLSGSGLGVSVIVRTS